MARMFNTDAMTLTRRHTSGLRIGIQPLLVLSLLFQFSTLGYVQANCSTSPPGINVCSGASVADVALQNPCCCPQITPCYLLTMVASTAIGETTLTKWDASERLLQARTSEFRAHRRAFPNPRLEPNVQRPPLHILYSAFLI